MICGKILLAAGLALGSAGLARAQSLETLKGRHIAEDVCSQCHQIDALSRPKHPPIDAPSFVDIARMPSTNELAIKVFLRSSHNHMPNIALTRGEIDSITAYIMSLAKK